MSTDTIWVRRPTAQPAGEVSAPTFRLDRPLTGLTIGLRTDRAWRSWQAIAAIWDEYLRRDGAQTIAVETGAQIGHPASSDRKEIEELAVHVDAAIVGLGTCGSCTTFTIKDAVTVEEHEKPVVAVVCDEFTVHAHNVARHVGHADLNVLVLPYPLEARPAEELRRDRRRVLPEGPRAPGRVGMTLASERVEVPADPRALYQLSLDDHWSDGVPQLPATDDAIEALLAASPYPADHVVCVLPPVNGVATVELVAINAALAGVEPAAFGVVLAALEALSEPEWNAFGLTTTTSSVFPMLIVNGPCRDELAIDYRASCMGGAAGRGSMTIGRAVALCLRNIGGQRAGETTKSVFGQPARFGFCIGEWEERSPWPSLAQRRGFTVDDDVVTVHGGKGTFPMADIHNDDARDLLYSDRQEPRVPVGEHVPRQRRQR